MQESSFPVMYLCPIITTSKRPNKHLTDRSKRPFCASKLASKVRALPLVGGGGNVEEAMCNVEALWMRQCACLVLMAVFKG